MREFSRDTNANAKKNYPHLPQCALDDFLFLRFELRFQKPIKMPCLRF
jgi:hypothetical protein